MFPKRIERYQYIDYLRGFMVLLVVLDHSMHAYAPHFKRFWYIPDFGGLAFFDVWHMHNDMIMMPLLFFLSGIFVLSSYDRRGLIGFTKEKFFRLVVPFTVGVLVIVPPQTFGKYQLFRNPEIGYLDYLQNIYFFEGIALSAFWFLSMLLVLSFAAVVLRHSCPPVLRFFENLSLGFKTHPRKTVLGVFLILAVLLGVSDLIWGAHWWVHFTKLLSVRGSRFLSNTFCFFLGVGFGAAGLHKDKAFLEKIAHHWKQWFAAVVLIGAVYISYSLVNFTQPGGPYNIEVLRALRQGAEFTDVLDVALYYAPPILVRTSLMAAFLIALIGFYLSVFYRFLNRESSVWQSLAACSFGLYVFHEPVTVWSHIYFFESATPEILKFCVTAFLSVAFGWGVTHYLRPLPGFKRVL